MFWIHNYTEEQIIRRLSKLRLSNFSYFHLENTADAKSAGTSPISSSPNFYALVRGEAGPIIARGPGTFRVLELNPRDQVEKLTFTSINIKLCGALWSFSRKLLVIFKYNFSSSCSNLSMSSLGIFWRLFTK